MGNGEHRLGCGQARVWEPSVDRMRTQAAAQGLRGQDREPPSLCLEAGAAARACSVPGRIREASLFLSGCRGTRDREQTGLGSSPARPVGQPACAGLVGTALSRGCPPGRGQTVHLPTTCPVSTVPALPSFRSWRKCHFLGEAIFSFTPNHLYLHSLPFS